MRENFITLLFIAVYIIKLWFIYLFKTLWMNIVPKVRKIFTSRFLFFQFLLLIKKNNIHHTQEKDRLQSLMKHKVIDIKKGVILH